MELRGTARLSVTRSDDTTGPGGHLRVLSGRLRHGSGTLLETGRPRRAAYRPARQLDQPDRACLIRYLAHVWDRWNTVVSRRPLSTRADSGVGSDYQVRRWRRVVASRCDAGH